MKNFTLPVLALIVIAGSYTMQAQSVKEAQSVPVRPAHVIMVMEENYAYNEIIGNSLCPVLNKLATEPYTALFTDYYAIEHPSEPNYLDLFSGQNQGITFDWSGQYNNPLTDCNMGAALIQKGFTFKGYSEDQPSLGWYAGDAAPYYTKHSPWINWINCTSNDSVPLVDDIPYSYLNGYTTGPIFPDSSNYASLPTVTWVIPNSINDMHDNSESSALPAGDSWFHKNMMPLVRWCSNAANNSVMFVTWDEDDGSESNKVVMMACGGIVNGGTYNNSLNHYSWLKTVEDMYGATECSNAASASDFPNSMWKITDVPAVSQSAQVVNTWPNPAKNELNVKITASTETQTTFGIYDITGRLVKEIPTELKSGENNLLIGTTDIADGFYFLKITGNNINLCTKIAVAK